MQSSLLHAEVRQELTRNAECIPVAPEGGRRKVVDDMVAIHLSMQIVKPNADACEPVQDRLGMARNHQAVVVELGADEVGLGIGDGQMEGVQKQGQVWAQSRRERGRG